jgi:hypothetical protein
MNLYTLLGDFASVVYDHELSSIPEMNATMTMSMRNNASHNNNDDTKEGSSSPSLLSLMSLSPTEAESRAREAYQSAWQMYLDGREPILSTALLGVALNYSIFMVEIEKDVAGGIEFAQAAFDKVLTLSLQL